MAEVKRLGRRRLAAFAVDYLVIAAYVGVLVATAFAFGASSASPVTFADKLRGHGLRILTLTMPV